MNLVRARRTGAAALLAFLLSAGPSLADVKLRIYLQDGALQAGTLVTETPKSFVILTNEGRVEVPKSSIMFINGKTLKQWQDRPDKLFQTEIMPSDVPDPSYVNDKSLPPAPPVPSLPVAAKAALVPKAPPSASAAAPVAAASVSEKEAAPAKPSGEEKPAVKAVAEKPAPNPRASKRIARARPASKTEAAHPVAVHAAESPAVAANVRGSAPAPGIPAGLGRFDRMSAGAAHRIRAQEFNRLGEKGRAIQEYQIARLLEPSNPENPLELGRLYLEQGAPAEASRYFSSPLLRKSDEAKEQVQKIAKSLDANEETEWRLRAVTLTASFAWLPLVVGMRFLRRRRKVSPTTTIRADDLQPESVLASPVPAPVMKQAAPSFEETVELPSAPMPEAPAVEPRYVPAEEPGVFSEAPAEEFAPAPLEEEPAPEPIPIVEEPSVVEDPVRPYEEPPRVFASAPGIPPPDPDEILSVARTMEVSLMRGNQFAIEGRLEEARRAYRTALALNPSCTSAHLGLGYLSFAEEKWETALLHYRKALEIDPGSADAHYGAARVLLEVNRVEDALPELRATLQIDPTYDDARDTLTALSKPA